MSEEIEDALGDWDYSSLPDNVRIGHDCIIERRGSFARYRSKKDPGLVMGDRVRVYVWTAFNIEPTGRVNIGEDSVLVGAVFMCAESITIGKRVTVSYNVTIADSDFHPIGLKERRLDAVANAPFGDKSRRPDVQTAPVEIGDDVWIGMGAIILKGVKIGRGARIGSGAVITNNVPPGASMAGNPARLVASGKQ
jgi:acetyltransferase-like isoleucine patch superfamily enzyme